LFHTPKPEVLDVQIPLLILISVLLPESSIVNDVHILVFNPRILAFPPHGGGLSWSRLINILTGTVFARTASRT
jgi:hypothetical protein